jgi:hypothetical protein
MVKGKLNFTCITETKYETIGFGEPIEKNYTTNISELIITGGSQTPLEGDFAYDNDEIQAALTAHKEDLDAQKAKKLSSATTATPVAQKGGFDLGF